MTYPSSSLLRSRHRTQRQRHGEHPGVTRSVAAIVLGGEGCSRLFPLTGPTCKGTLPLAGTHRVIDSSIANCLKHQVDQIFVINEADNHSLTRHVAETYQNHWSSDGYVQLLSPLDTLYPSTITTLRHHLETLEEIPVDYFLVVSGTHLNDVNIAEMVRLGKHTQADIVVAVGANKPAPGLKGALLGLDGYRILSFIEGYEQAVSGTYLIKKTAFSRLLELAHRDNFFEGLIEPGLDQDSITTIAYRHDGFAQPIHNIRAFWEANLLFTKAPGTLAHLYGRSAPRAFPMLPPSRISHCAVTESLLCNGCTLSNAIVTHSVIGPGSMIGEKTTLDHTYVMGLDAWSPPGLHKAEIGDHVSLRNVVVGTNAVIGDNVSLTNAAGHIYYNDAVVYVREGIIIVPPDAVIPSGYTL